MLAKVGELFEAFQLQTPVKLGDCKWVRLLLVVLGKGLEIAALCRFIISACLGGCAELAAA